MQYIAAIIPPAFILLALVVFQLFEKSVFQQSAFILVLIFTNLVHVGPILPIKHLLFSNPEEFSTTEYKKNVYKTIEREVAFKSKFSGYWHELTHRYKGPLDELVSFFETNGKKGETCYIDNESESLMVLSPLTMIREKDLTFKSRPDWIVLRGNQRASQLNKAALKVRKALSAILSTSNYEKIVLNAPVTRINNSYDIQIHRFRTPTTPERVHVYRRILENGISPNLP